MINLKKTAQVAALAAAGILAGKGAADIAETPVIAANLGQRAIWTESGRMEVVAATEGSFGRVDVALKFTNPSKEQNPDFILKATLVPEYLGLKKSEVVAGRKLDVVFNGHSEVLSAEAVKN